jgi:hypothetical protein
MTLQTAPADTWNEGGGAFGDEASGVRWLGTRTREGTPTDAGRRDAGDLVVLGSLHAHRLLELLGSTR